MSVVGRTYDELVEALRRAESQIQAFEERTLLLDAEHRCTVDALRKSEARYRRLVETADEGVWTLDASGKTDFVNARGAAILGHRADDLLGRGPADFVFPEDAATGHEEVAKNQRGEHQSQTFRMRHKLGHEVWVLANTSPILGEDGASVVGAFSMFTDVTERRRAEIEREAQFKALEAALSEVQQLRTLLPVCSYCRRVRGDDDYWQHIEAYLTERAGSQFTHGICPDCADTHFPELDLKEE